MGTETIINWAEVGIACIPSLITAIVSFIILKIQIDKTTAIAIKDRKANLNYTRYQCEWQRIKEIRENGSRLILLHDLNNFIEWANKIESKEFNHSNPANELRNQIDEAFINFQFSLDFTNQDNRDFYNLICEQFKSYINVVYDVLLIVKCLDYREDNFIKNITCYCKEDFKSYYPKKASLYTQISELDRHEIVLKNYLIYKGHSKELENNLEIIRRHITEYTSNLEVKNRSTLE